MDPLALYRLEDFGLDLWALSQEFKAMMAHTDPVTGETVAPRLKISLLCKVVAAGISVGDFQPTPLQVAAQLKPGQFLPALVAATKALSIMNEIDNASAAKLMPREEPIQIREPAAKLQ